jgi:PadR family transcriptional regulator AphA
MGTDEIRRSTTDFVVLALLAEQPRHGFAIARELQPRTDLGRILTVRRSSVYRSLDRLVAAGDAVADDAEPGDAGPDRTPVGITPTGRDLLQGWFAEPVAHVRDLRIEFLIKLRLAERTGRDPRDLVLRQRRALDETLRKLSRPSHGADMVERWRRHSAMAARQFLDEIA